MHQMNPAWRTTVVVELCRSMREANDFSALPILADALQDAGCDWEDTLAGMRKPVIPLGITATMCLVAVIMSVETEAAVAGIAGLAKLLGPSYGYDSYEVDEDGNLDGVPLPPVQEMNVDVLIAAADDEYGITQYGSESWRDRMTTDLYAEFWKNYTLVTGRPARTDDYDGKPERFIGCSC